MLTALHAFLCFHCSKNSTTVSNLPATDSEAYYCSTDVFQGEHKGIFVLHCSEVSGSPLLTIAGHVSMLPVGAGWGNNLNTDSGRNGSSSLFCSVNRECQSQNGNCSAGQCGMHADTLMASVQ